MRQPLVTAWNSFLTALETATATPLAIQTVQAAIARAMPQGDILGFAPPLCITREECDQVVSALQGAVEEVLG